VWDGKQENVKTVHADVIVVGGGIAGLACGKCLHQGSAPFLILEASGRIGGRLKTNPVEGFLLDHGFQVLQTAYPEAQRTLNYRSLDLCPFAPGAVVRLRGRFYRVADPLRASRFALDTLFAPVGTLGDKMRVLRLVGRLSRMNADDLFRQREHSALDFLRREGFSERIIEAFFKPFFGGVCLDPEIQASSRVLQYVFWILAHGDAALPSQGIGSIPAQMAAQMPEGCIRTRMRVKRIDAGQVVLESGEKLTCRAVVVATEGPEAARILSVEKRPGSRGVSCLYYAASEPPMEDKLIVLNGEGTGPISSLCVVSNVAPAYAPPRQALVAVTVLDDRLEDPKTLDSAVRNQLRDWYGQQARRWRLLKIYRIRHGLPLQRPPTPDPTRVDPRVRRGVYVCGEYRSVPSIQWAMLSGRKAAEAYMKDRGMKQMTNDADH
jgi:phytoene dehydrogenase-like protein